MALNPEVDKKIRPAEKEAIGKSGSNRIKRNMERSQCRSLQYPSYGGRYAGQRSTFRFLTSPCSSDNRINQGDSVISVKIPGIGGTNAQSVLQDPLPSETAVAQPQVPLPVVRS